MRRVLIPLVFAGVTFGNDLFLGYQQRNLKFQGPGEWRESAEPIWVYDYHMLRLRYQASGLPKSDAPVLTLRPGSVGPVTPGANNPENPFVAGTPVVVIRARDLVADGASHTVEIELRGKMRTTRIDQLQFALPAGAHLSIAELQFLGDADVFPCRAGGPALPGNAAKLAIHGPFTCAGSPATSLRGRESIQIDGGGRKGCTLYLSLMAHFAGVSGFGADYSMDRTRVKESSETADVVARVKYADGSQEDQFPTLVKEERHALLNRKAALYELALDSSRGVRSVELMDRSPHAQLALFAAGLSPDAAPRATDEFSLPTRRADKQAAGEADLTGSKWYRTTAVAGAVRADLGVTPAPGTRRLSLSLTNVSREPQSFKLYFPSLAVRPSPDPGDAYYVFPRQGAIISNAEQTIEGLYSGLFPLQFVDVFAPAANRGACLIVQDTNGRMKQFRLKKSGAQVEIEVEYTVRLAAGETLRLPDAQVVPHGGDWREGWGAYRAWLKSWYKPAGPRPAWVRSAFWARRDYPVGGTEQLFDVRGNRYTFEKFIRDGEAFGGIDFIDISGWAMSNTVGRVGDYPIELGGAEDLRRNIAIGNAAHIPTGLYFEGYLIDKNSAVGRKSGEQWQIIDEKGQGHWWAGKVELFACPYASAWQQYLAGRTSAVAREVGAAGVYLDEYGFGRQRCYATTHGHPPGIETLPGEIAMAKTVRRALDAAGMRETILYIEETPPDAAAPCYDAAFCYNFASANRGLSPLKLNLWRFAFPDIRLWDMVSIGIDPRELPAEDFRLSLWHGNGLWLKGHSDTWYGEDLLAFLQRAHGLLKQHAAAFAGVADPLIDSPHPAVFINRFRGGEETVYTLFNASYRTVRFQFQGRERTLGPRDVDVAAVR
jgi:hypothetical protein